jgi:hypothetical protein
MPKSYVLSTLAAVVSVALYGLDGMVSGVDHSTLLLNAGMLLLPGLFTLVLNIDARWPASVYGVTVVGTMGATLIDGMHALLTSPIWGDLPVFLGWASAAFSAWFTFTIIRLAIAMARDANRRFPMPRK